MHEDVKAKPDTINNRVSDCVLQSCVTHEAHSESSEQTSETGRS